MDTRTYQEIQLKTVASAINYTQLDKQHQHAQYNTVSHASSKKLAIDANLADMSSTTQQVEFKHVSYAHNLTVQNATIVWEHANFVLTDMHLTQQQENASTQQLQTAINQITVCVLNVNQVTE